ncbi:MAG: DUF1015 domain-containing protein [Planctomycetota bacterium]|nr:DUF1015 domain-containing protein [Planctomycetota bacterium]
MAEIQPFQAFRYSQSDLSDLIAPPYDVLTKKDKADLISKHEQNIVSIDLPHLPPKTAGPDEAYERAAGELVSWIDTHRLVRDPEPALYVYHQTYNLAGQTLTRKMFFARLRLEPLGKGRVFAHEQTFGGPKEDRLKLTQATRCNLSPIFALYPDAENEVAGILDGAIEDEPDHSAMMDGVLNKVWVVTDSLTVTEVQEKLGELPIYIADGHHRYSTALNFRQFRDDEQEGESDPDDPQNFVLTALAGMEDPGATIRPYFRTVADLPRLTTADLTAALHDAFKATQVPRPTNEGDLARQLSTAGPHALALNVAKDGICTILVPRDVDMLAKLEPDRHPSWRKLPYTVLHRYIIDEIIRRQFNDGNAPKIHYHKTMDDAIDDARKNHGFAALMPATTMSELRDVCTAGELMPQKSTYFHPKLATGLVINPLY